MGGQDYPVRTGPRVATFDELDTPTLYGLLRLRVDVFVVEQHCPYPELDGRDLTARHPARLARRRQRARRVFARA